MTSRPRVDVSAIAAVPGGPRGRGWPLELVEHALPRCRRSSAIQPVTSRHQAAVAVAVAPIQAPHSTSSSAVQFAGSLDDLAHQVPSSSARASCCTLREERILLLLGGSEVQHWGGVL